MAKKHPRELLNLPELQPLQQMAASEMREYLDSLDEDEKHRLFQAGEAKL